MTAGAEDVPEDLLAEFAELRDAGVDVTPEQFAADHPDHGPALLARLRALLQVEGMFPGSAPSVGGEIGGYRIERELGRGGMGRVFAVRRPGAERSFALKLLSPLLAADERAAERFRREAEALRCFDHPGAARIHEYGHHDGMPYLVMDRVEGEPLAALLARAHAETTSVPPADRLELPGPGGGEERAARVCAELARTVAAAHAQGIVHRDLKPSNVILRSDGVPVLIDFGLARRSGTPTLTASGELLGTPQYMAPELVLGLRADHRVDVYALGAMLYEMVTGGLPYDAAEPTGVLAQMQRLPPRPPRRREPRVSRAMATIVRRALATRREHRFQDANALADALDAFVAGRPATRLPVALRLYDGWRWHRRKVLGCAAVAAVVAAALLYDGARAARVRRAVELVMPRAIAARLDGDAAAVQALGVELRTAAASPLHDYFASWQPAPGPRAAADPMVTALCAGDAATSRGDFDAAGAEYRRAADAGAPAALVAGLLGLAASGAGDSEVAARELTAAVRQMPDVAILQQRLGEALTARGEDAAAADALGRAAELRDTDGALWHAYASAAGKAGRLHEALAAVQRAIERAGADEVDGYRRTQAALLNGLGDKDASIAVFRALVERMPTRANLLYNLGFTYDGAHRFREARDCYERALAVDADHHDSLGCLAWMLAGARLDCEECKAWFAANPGFADPQRATDLVLRLVRIDRGRRRESLGMAVEIAHRAHRTADLKQVVEELLALPEQDDATVGRLTRLLKKL